MDTLYKGPKCGLELSPSVACVKIFSGAGTDREHLNIKPPRKN